MKKSLLTKVAKGIAFGDVSNYAVRNILTEISKCLKGSITEKDIEETLDFFDWKCPYTGKDLRKLIENDLGGYVTDHIYPQNKEWCGLNVKGNLILVDKTANDKKNDKDVETFLLTDTKVLTDLDENGKTRKERLDKIKAFQKKCGYDPCEIRKVVGPLMEKRYDEARVQQEKSIQDTLDILKATGIHAAVYDYSLLKASSTATKGSKGTSISTKKYTYDEKINAVAYYLRTGKGLIQIEEEYMKLFGKKGWIAKAILNELGVDTSRKSIHKGLLSGANIDDEIAKASGTFKITLEEIKKRSL